MKLEATRKDELTKGTHGGFKFNNVEFWLSQGQTTGFIIQHVKRDFDVKRLTNGAASKTKMTATEITTYIGGQGDPAFPAITEYWEAWPLATGNERIEDSFNLTDFMSDQKFYYYQLGTDGKFKQTGEAIFYACANPIHVLEVDLGFTLDHTITNGLLYRSMVPDAKKLPTLISNSVSRETSVSWADSNFHSAGSKYPTIKGTDTP